jgi:hypothetical protein
MNAKLQGTAHAEIFTGDEDVLEDAETGIVLRSDKN